MSTAQLLRAAGVALLAVPASMAGEYVGGALVVVPFLMWRGYWLLRPAT